MTNQMPVSLDKKWKEIVFAMSGFGPNLLMVMLTAYFSDAVIVDGLLADKALWSIAGVNLVVSSVFPIIFALNFLARSNLIKNTYCTPKKRKYYRCLFYNISATNQKQNSKIGIV